MRLGGEPRRIFLKRKKSKSLLKFEKVSAKLTDEVSSFLSENLHKE